MDYIFQFAQPFVEFFCANYKNGCFLFIFLAITGIIIIVHLDKDSQGNHNTSVDEVCMMSMVCVIFILIWPVILSFYSWCLLFLLLNSWINY